MPERPISIMSVNVHHDNAVTHALLQTSPHDILLIQEPWIGSIQTARSDTNPLGSAIAGAAANSLWERPYLPSFTDPSSIRIAIYIKIDISRTFNIVNHVDHPLSSPESMVFDISFESEILCLVNIYHRVPRGGGHNLLHLFCSSLDPLIPTLLMGDFNTHSHIWSLLSATISPWADALVNWFDDQGLELLNPHRLPTWNSSRDDRHESILDLALLNEAGAISGQISPLSISFQESVHSDYAALILTWHPAESIALAPPPLLVGYSVDDSLSESWTKSFSPLLSPPIHDIASLQAAADQLHNDINHASSTVFSPRRYPDPRGVRWWNQECADKLTSVYHSVGTARVTAVRALRRSISHSKRVWAHDFLHHTTSENLWAATAWRKGCSVKRIPPIFGVHHHITQDPVEMTEALKARFFNPTRLPVDPIQPDDPTPLPTCDFIPITKDEVANALCKTSNKSAPGSSGITYKLIKWAFAARPDRFLETFNAAISLGYHPWSEAVVVILPKPSKPDYRLPKAYRPISLLECCGKLLEKVIAKRVLSDAHSFDILPPHQFGSRDYHCATDATLCLVHNAQAAIATGHTASTLLFDISGFFDNINIDRAIAIFTNLGFPSSLCRWIKLFLSNHQIRLSFNDFLSDPFPLDHGTPQGSPLSPILSAIFTSPLLKLVNTSWTQRGLQMYVDDGAITATHILSKVSANLVVTGYNEVAAWLFRNGLRMDQDKTEFITFAPKKSANTCGGMITEIALTNPALGRYPVKRSDLVRYLGVFIHHHFDWSYHVTIMANHARSTVRALNLLGNSVQGLDFANWRRLFHALILPILTYGFPLYANNPRIQGLLRTLQVAQNEMVRKMSGTFKTSPILPLHYLLAIPPFPLTLKKLSRQFSNRLERLPPHSLIRTILTYNKVAAWHLSVNPVTSLSRALRPTSSPFTYPSHPSLPTWSHTRVRNNTRDAAVRLSPVRG